jgi:hypothetical protein
MAWVEPYTKRAAGEREKVLIVSAGHLPPANFWRLFCRFFRRPVSTNSALPAKAAERAVHWQPQHKISIFISVISSCKAAKFSYSANKRGQKICDRQTRYGQPRQRVLPLLTCLYFADPQTSPYAPPTVLTTPSYAIARAATSRSGIFKYPDPINLTRRSSSGDQIGTAPRDPPHMAITSGGTTRSAPAARAFHRLRTRCGVAARGLKGYRATG